MVIPHPSIRYRAPFVTVAAHFALPQIAVAQSSTPEAARAACAWLADNTNSPNVAKFWRSMAERRVYSDTLHQ